MMLTEKRGIACHGAEHVIRLGAGNETVKLER
jgi:hypothetical protein